MKLKQYPPLFSQDISSTGLENNLILKQIKTEEIHIKKKSYKTPNIVISKESEI